MQLLMHICCGPCTTYPLSALREKGIEPQGYFFNPNIHPFKEFKRRLSALETVESEMRLAIDYEREYGLNDYLRQVVHNEKKRCLICYEMRLTATALKAKELQAEAFTTTLLYSRYQNHEAIRIIGERLAAEHDLSFYYEDFREGWQEGIDQAIEMDIYRQPYCGCIYSEQERYDKKFRKEQKEKAI